MAIPILLEDVERALRPWLGVLFLSSNSFAAELAEKLRGHAPYRQTLEELRTDVESYMITRLTRFTDGTMQVMLDNFRSARRTMQDVRWMTDDVMGILFERLTPMAINFEKLNDYALRVESLAAMRVLYQNFASFFTAEELRFLVDTIRQIYPPYRYEGWLGIME